MSEYYKLLKDPRWQKRRLEIFDNAHFACEECGDKNETLHAHHRYYEKNTDPWDYPDEAYVCLCETCHVRVHFVTDEIKRQFRSFSVEAYEQVMGFVIARNHWAFESLDFHPKDDIVAEGFAQFYGLDCQILLDFLKKHGKINYKQAVKLKENG